MGDVDRFASDLSRDPGLVRRILAMARPLAPAPSELVILCDAETAEQAICRAIAVRFTTGRTVRIRLEE